MNKQFAQLTPVIFILLLQLLFAQENQQNKIDSLTTLFNHEKDYKAKQELLTNISDIYEYQGEWQKYEEVVKQIIDLAEEANDSSYVAESYNLLGISNCYMGKNKEALEYFKKALALFESLNEMIEVSNSYENLGLVYTDIGEYQNSMDCQIKSLEIRKKHNHPRIFNNYMKLAVLQRYIDNIKKQDEYIKLAKKELKNRENVAPDEQAIFYNQLGDLYGDRGMYDSSIVCHKKVFHYSKIAGWNRGISAGLASLAGVYTKIGELDSAIVMHKQSLKLSEEIDDCRSISEINFYLAELYLKTNQLVLMKFHAEQSLDKAEDCDLLSMQSKSLNLIAKYHLLKKNYKLAYSFSARYHTLKDSIASSEVKNNIADLETRYQTAAKEQQIELLTSENKVKNQRIALFITITILMLLAITVGILDFFRRKKQTVQKLGTLQQQLLRSQMNPHFLFNALGSIQNYMYKNETKKAAGYLNNFSLLTRSILEHSEEELIPLSDEIETLRNYFELEKMRTNDGFDYIIICNDSLDTEFINIPPMFLQPFIENAIKHGIKNIDYPGLISVKFEEKRKELFIEISDNGKGIDKDKKDENRMHKSMSMKIFEERRVLLSKRYKVNIDCSIADRSKFNEEETGTLIKINLPIDL